MCIRDRVIGLCNVPVNMVAGIAKILGVEENRVTLELQGVNHFIFATDVFVDGSSVMDTIVEKYANCLLYTSKVECSGYRQIPNLAMISLL